MIAQRFRPVGWVAGVAAAACALYLISLQVASERGRLEELDRKIATTKRDIRQLQTELNTRASLRQLERWNGEVLALSAPAAGQYLESEGALVRFDKSGLGKTAAAPPPVMMAVLTSAVQTELKPQPEPTLLARLTAKPEVKPLTKTDKQVQQALTAKPGPKRVALLDRALMSDLSSTAASEKAKRGSARQ